MDTEIFINGCELRYMFSRHHYPYTWLKERRMSMPKVNERCPDYACLSNEDGYTVFQYRDTVIKFKAPYSLEYYTAVKEWDNGYLVVMAKYRHNKENEEEYIDLIPILESLHFDSEEFLEPIKRVIIKKGNITDEDRQISG